MPGLVRLKSTKFNRQVCVNKRFLYRRYTVRGVSSFVVALLRGGKLFNPPNEEESVIFYKVRLDR